MSAQAAPTRTPILSAVDLDNFESFTAENATIATAASIWRPLGESQDALAKRTPEYLTGLQDERVSR